MPTIYGTPKLVSASAISTKIPAWVVNSGMRLVASVCLALLNSPHFNAGPESSGILTVAPASACHKYAIKTDSGTKISANALAHSISK